MPKVSIYIPDGMYDEVRRHRLPLSQIAQRAIAEALKSDRNAAWIDAARERSTRHSTLSSESLMAAVDDEFDA